MSLYCPRSPPKRTPIFNSDRLYISQFVRNCVNLKLTQLRTNWEMYNRSELKIGVRFGGDRGQYKLIESNIFRSILTGLVAVICNQRPSFQPEAVNDDHRSMSQDLIFNSVSDYYLKVKKLEDVYKQGTIVGLNTGEGWLYEHWDANVG